MGRKKGSLISFINKIQLMTKIEQLDYNQIYVYYLNYENSV
jgi:hypothetical protein